VQAAGSLRHGPAPFVAALAGVLAPGGRAALLVGPGQADGVAAAAGDAGLRVADTRPLAVAGTWVTLVVLAGPGHSP
jgi:hypothetical protein